MLFRQLKPSLTLSYGLIGMLVLLTGLLPLPGMAQGTLPSLESSSTVNASLTPADYEAQGAISPVSDSPTYGLSPNPETLQPILKPSTSVPQAAHQAGQQSNDSAHASKGLKGHLNLGIRDLKIQELFHQIQQLPPGIQPVSYSPLEGIVVFPVLKHGNERAFGDLPLIFAREFSQNLESRVPNTKVYHPIYTVDELRMQGIGHVYDQIMRYYLKAGRPEPRAMDYLLKQISDNDKPISRVVFVEADLDMSHPDQDTHPVEWAKRIFTDGSPQQIKYFVKSRVQFFDAEKPEFPLLWGGSWSRSVKNNQFYNVTASVFQDSDSQQSFASTSRLMSREMLWVTPKAAYMAPQFDTAVQGKRVDNNNLNSDDSDVSALHPSKRRLSSENKDAIRRILGQQGK